MNNTPSIACGELVKQFEGLCLKAEKCPAGVPTIGYGHTKGVKMGDTCTKDAADLMLIADLTECAEHVNAIDKKYHYNFNQNEFDALVSFTFNVGSINQLTANGARNKEVIADKMLLYIKAGGKVLRGLQRRREAERKLFLTPCEAVKVPTKEKKKTIEEVAKEVIAGKWGNGNERKEKLTAAGYNYKSVQSKVNKLLK